MISSSNDLFGFGVRGLEEKTGAGAESEQLANDVVFVGRRHALQ